LKSRRFHVRGKFVQQIHIRKRKKGTVGFIGLGVMGSPMATRLLESGYPLIVNDLVLSKVKALTKKGAKYAETPKEVTEKSEIIISVLPTPEIIEDVVFQKNGIFQGIGPQKIYVDMSTSSLGLTRRVHKAIKAKGARMLDAPVSGGEQGAISGRLSIMVGGDRKTFEECKQLFACLGEKAHYIGKAGSGLTMKLVNNLLYSIIMCGTAEVLTLGRKLGLDLEMMVDVLGTSSASSYVLSEKVKQFIIPDNYVPGASIDIIIKDLDLASEIARPAGVPLILSSLSRQLYQVAKNCGLGNQDISAVIKLFEGGMTIKSR